MGEESEKLGFIEGLNKIQFEHQLIDHRMKWQFTAQAMLFAAYFAVRTRFIITNKEYSIYMDLISICALIYSFVFLLSIFAAHRAIHKWKNSTTEKLIYLTSDHLTHFFGDAPPFVINISMIVFWILIRIEDQSIYRYFDSNIDYPAVIVIMSVIIGGLIWFSFSRSGFDKKRSQA